MNEIDEAIEILTGLSAGTRGENNEFDEGSVNAKVESRLLEFARLAHESEDHKTEEEEHEN